MLLDEQSTVFCHGTSNKTEDVLADFIAIVVQAPTQPICVCTWTHPVSLFRSHSVRFVWGMSRLAPTSDGWFFVKVDSKSLDLRQLRLI